MSIVIQLPRDINRFCRTCMGITEDHKDSFDNYVIHNNQPTDLSIMLSSVTSLDVTADDGLPETLCSSCMEHLTTAYTFINQCKSVDTNLRNLLVLSKSVEGKIETESQLDNLVVTSQTLPKKVCISEDSNHMCQICYDTFISYYYLSMHMIEHNKNKSLYERLLENQEESPKTTENCETVDTDIEIVNLIKELKANSKTNNGNNDEKLEIDSVKIVTNDVFKHNSKTKVSKVEIQCRMCDKDFNSRKELVLHICTPLVNEEGTNDVDSRFTTVCSLCDKICSDSSTLSLHFLKHALATTNARNVTIEAEFFFCEVCGETFESESFLLDHYNNKHEGKPTWPCSHCSEVFEKESDLIRHDDIHCNKKPDICIEKESFPCMLCNGTYISKKALLKHSIEHLVKKYSCKKCSLSFCTQPSYFAHLTSHSLYQYECPTCGKCLSTKSALKSHIVGVHSVELRHTCTTCGKSFTTAHRLRTHSQIHEDNKKYTCMYCGYNTHKAGDLQIHIRTHTSERPYKCTFAKCTASFKTSSHLCDHVRRHMGIRKFKCSICLTGFSTNYGLKIHQMQHTGERPHSCSVCYQKFRRKNHLKIHMKQHEPKK